MKNPLQSRGRSMRSYKSSTKPSISGIDNSNFEGATAISKRFQEVGVTDELDEKLGFPRYEAGPKKIGWLVNMHSTTRKLDNIAENGNAGVDYYFLDDEGGGFKSTLFFDPYFLIICKKGYEAEVEEYLKKILEGVLKSIVRLVKEDLQLPNHLVGNNQTVIQLNFHNVTDLLAARREIMPLVLKNKSKQDDDDIMQDFNINSLANNLEDNSANKTIQNPDELIHDIREYDVPYHVRVAIDKNVRVGKWYTVEAKEGNVELTEMPERQMRADPVVLAFDIETTKDDLQFPDASRDKVMMISYMIDGEGFLITNREIVSQDIDDFEYTPKPEFPGEFTIFNEPNEKAVLERFFEHIQDAQPSVIATFNGDFFDWPFVETRAEQNGINMYEQIGFQKDSEEEYKSTHCCHMDCFRWVKRDSYLPQGSQGLKAVTSKKLGYNPIELDPELMTKYAEEKPQTLAEYSVSDAVATYYLYMKYVHPFIFSLCNIIPLNPDEVLRKGTGTLCEMLLMVQAYQGNILLPNKHTDPLERFYEGHLVETETYVGGHVESLETGVFRCDIPYKFSVDESAVDEILNDLDKALTFSIEVENNKTLDDITNYDQVKQEITEALMKLKLEPHRNEKPSIYHVDVASMYPNIMTTNRLQPDSMISEDVCASCDYNRPGKTCDRRLPWSWRGEYYPANKDEYRMIRNILTTEMFPPKRPNGPPRRFDTLSPTEQAAQIKKRVSDYSKKNYNRLRETRTVEREAIICQRENPFYVNTVRDFRDRRYHFKGEQKVWVKKLATIPANDAASREDAKKMIVLFESLQLAHKVILNSFYGYVMRKGSRWYSMEMAGVTCLTGATIIQMARSLVERLGRPLELDTDGIWCILPGSFPEDFSFKTKDGKKISISYPCVMLNHLVHERFTNHQYQSLDPETGKYTTVSDNSIFFEVDGPYRAMILPTSKEEGKGLKKRYAVFEHDGSISELKGFELKRRGELKLIKMFQSQVFSKFLLGDTLKECYDAVATVANNWLDILESKGRTLDAEELLSLISENKSMSKSLKEYGDQKSTSITTARRLSEFLGENMVSKPGLNCQYIIADRPIGAPVTERAIPVAIFSADPNVRKNFLRQWLKDPNLDALDARAILDWGYYWDRLASTIQKIITIPAGIQGVDNPVSRIPHPEWLEKRIRSERSGLKQQKLTGFFAKSKTVDIGDIEDIAHNRELIASKPFTQPKIARVITAAKRRNEAVITEPPEAQHENMPSVENAPSIEGEYSDWLKYQKKVWKIQKLERARRRHIFGTANKTATSGIAGMMQRQVEKTYTNQNWNIVQLDETDRLGEVRATIAVGGRLQTVRIHVPRVFYVNFKSGFFVSELERMLHNCKIEKENKILPDGSKPAMLFKLTMTEEAYSKEMAKPDSILKHPLVEGLYETNISPVQNAIMRLGLACTLDDSRPGLLGRGLETGFELDWLIPCDQHAVGNYLDSSLFYYIHVFHISFTGHQIIAIIPTWSDKAHVLVLGPAGQAQSLTNISRQYAMQLVNLKQRRSTRRNLFEYPENISFSETRFNSFGRMCSTAGKILENLQSEHSIQTIVVLQSPTPERIKGMVRTINDFPICEIKAADTSTFSAIGWQPQATKKLVGQFLGLNKWLCDLHNLAKFGSIPLCNFKWDDTRYIIDITYARQLRAAGLVLWWSTSPLPDEGGKEKDSMALVETDIRESLVVNNPGCYTNVCLDLDIVNLNVNTILTASLLMKAVNTDSMVAVSTEYDSGQVEESILPFVEGAFSTPAIMILSKMVRGWWTQALEGDNADLREYSESIIASLISWVSSRDSFMYHRILYQHVQNLSQKAFIQLVRELRVKHNAKLVFADQSHIVLLTSKGSIDTAYSHASYIIRSIRSFPIFQFLDIKIRRYWSRLLWMDDVNYGGLGCTEITEADISLDLEMNWDLQGFLPPLLAKEFESWVSKFISLVHQRMEAYSEENHSTQLPQTTEESADALKGIVKGLQKGFINQIKQLIHEQQTANSVNLKQVIEEENTDMIDLFEEFNLVGHPGNFLDALQDAMFISKKNGTKGIVLKDNNVNLLSIANQTVNRNMVLQLVKFVCAVFSLAKSIELEVQLFRRHILKLFEIREFSAEGNFVNPTASLKVCNVVCGWCNNVSDIDLCRGVSRAVVEQSKLIEVAGEGGLPNKDFGHSMALGRCADCGKNYDRLVIEELLIQQVHKLLTQYQVQDLKCLRCKKIREDEMSSYCPCSGEWVETLPRNEVLKNIAIYSHLAEFYGLQLLQNLVDELL